MEVSWHRHPLEITQFLHGSILEPKRTPVVITQLICLPFGARYENFLKRLQIHSEILSDEESMIQTKALSHIIRSQGDEIDQAEEHRRQSREYRGLVNAVMKKVSAAELSEYPDSNSPLP